MTNACKSIVIPQDIKTQLDIYNQVTKEIQYALQKKLPEELPEELPIELPEELPIELPIELPEELPVELPEELPEETQLAIIPNNLPLMFDGEFAGREHEIRITPDKMISVFDFITVVGGQANPKSTWERILREHKDELGIVAKCDYAQFGKTKKTPVVNVQGMVKILFWLPGELAKQFRAKSAETMIRFLGGDLEEFKQLQEEHIELPEETQLAIIPNNLPLMFDGEFAGREHEIRITPDKMISVFDFIRVVGGQVDPHSTWNRILNEHKKEVQAFCRNFKFEGQGQRLTPIVNVQGMVKLLFWLPGDLAKQFRAKSAEVMIRFLGGDLEEFKQLQEEHIELPEETQLVIIPNNLPLMFDGEFAGREHEIRITPDKMISVFDFITVVGGQKNFYDTWNDLKKKYGEEILGFSEDYKFGTKKKTPVVNVQGMVKLLFWLPGDLAKQFREKSAETMIRFLGGDLTLIDEIKAIDQAHVNNPNNNLQVFREEVTNQHLLNFDQINYSKQLLAHFGGKTDVFYMLQVFYSEKLYLKFGIVNIRDFFERFKEHLVEFGDDLCILEAFQSPDVTKIESEHKNSTFFKQHKTTIPKKYGGNHTEIYQLTETLTFPMIKTEILKTAGNRITDPPSYSQVIESSELTKQKEIELKIIECQELTKRDIELTKRKQIELEMDVEETKRMQIEFDMKNLEFEMMKFSRQV